MYIVLDISKFQGYWNTKGCHPFQEICIGYNCAEIERIRQQWTIIHVVSYAYRHVSRRNSYIFTYYGFLLQYTA